MRLISGNAHLVQQTIPCSRRSENSIRTSGKQLGAVFSTGCRITGPRTRIVCGKHSWSPWSRSRLTTSRCVVSVGLRCSRRSTQLVGGALQTRRGPQDGHVLGRQAHEVVWMLRRMVEQATEWQIPIFVMDCDVAAAFDHVSHHEIIKATFGAWRSRKC